MEEYKKYLAERLFTEDKMVTYRTLSRALKVNVNNAKRMLYEFHRWQNSTSPGKVHATYLVYGTRKPETGIQADGDVDMMSSAPESESWDHDVSTQTLTLVAEDRLKDVLASYLEVTSFQVYSLAAHPTKELQMLSDVAREVLQHSHEDPAEQSKAYGTLSNPNMRKRQGRRPQPTSASAPKPAEKKAAPATAAAAAAAITAPKPAESAKIKGEPESKSKPKDEPEEKPAQETRPSAASSASSKKAAPPALKKSGSSGIMSAFSKAAAKAGTKSASTSKTPTPKTEAAQSPALSDDGEDDEESLPAPQKPSQTSGRQSRKDREAELRRMMEESDGDEAEDKEEGDEEEEQEDENMEEAPEPEPEPEPQAEATADEKADEPAEVVSSTGDGRRRGKRRVMKKKQVMDDQGYLVTIQEQGWESFSEDEAPAPSKPKPSSAAASGGGSQASKAKKPAAKGQGNIMSFFAKK